MYGILSRAKRRTHIIGTPETPKRCPRGHLHISWSLGDEKIFCWDCNRKYPLSQCLDTRLSETPDAATTP